MWLTHTGRHEQSWSCHQSMGICKQRDELSCYSVQGLRPLFAAVQVCMSTDNLFSRCRQKSSVARGDEKNALRQLDIIGNFISDLEAMKDLHHPSHKVPTVS